MLLITGITGHTGGYFLKELIENKYDGPIRCLVRETSDTSKLLDCGLNIEILKGDLNNPKFIDESMNGVDTIVHIYNIHHSPIIIKKAIKNKVKRAILVHTTGIYSKFKDASFRYREIEKEIEDLTSSEFCTTNVTILRPTMIYGDLCDSNMSKFIKMIDSFRIFPVINNGKSLIQPVNARDLGKAYYKVLVMSKATENKAYDLSGEMPIELIEVLKSISKELGKKTIYINVPLKSGVTIAKIIKRISFNKIDLVEQVQRMGENRSYSHLHASQDFNYDPMSFKEGIKNEVKQYLEKK